MLDVFKARLKALFSGVNLSQKRMDAFADRLHKKFPDLKEEADHDARINELNELTPFDEIAKQDDKVRDLESKVKPPKTDPPPAPDPPKPPEPAKTDAEKLAALEAQFGQLSQQVKAFQEKEAKAKLNETLQAKLVAKKIPVAFAKRFSIEKEEELEAVLTEAETDYNTIVNGATEQRVGNTSEPLGSTMRTDNVANDIKEWAASNSKAAEKK